MLAFRKDSGDPVVVPPGIKGRRIIDPATSWPLPLRAEDLTVDACCFCCGIGNVAGESGPVILRAAQHVIHSPATLAGWRDADHGTLIVFITRNITRVAVAALFAAVGALVAL